MSTPWPDIAHTNDVAAEHYAATFAAELGGKRFDHDAFGLRVPVRATLVTLDEITTMAESAGLLVRERHERAPYPGECPSPRIYPWAEVRS